MNLNKVFLAGNLTRDPELRTLPSGVAVTSFGLATNRVWKNREGQRQEEVQFHNIVVFGRQAETTSQYLTKGSPVLVEGRIQTRSWDGKDGAKQYRTEIIAERVQFGSRGSGVGAGNQQTNEFRVPPTQNLPEIDIDEEDIKPEDLPF